MNWETVLGIVTHPVVQVVVTATAGVAVSGFMKYKKAYTAFIDIPQALLKARKPDSPGGKKITDAEYAALGKEIVEFVSEVAPLVKKGK